MARVTGVKEKVHLPIYDAFVVAKDKKFVDSVVPLGQRVIRFFADINGKTKLETNLQAPGVLPSQNTFESHALRVVASSVVKPKQLPSDVDAAEFRIRFLEDLIYHSVITLLVGEKVMIEMPTFWFPAGAGVSPGNGAGFSHGEPDPLATFRFSEPVYIEPSQNFRVDMLFPEDIPDTLKEILGPLRIWVVLDGYLTRDVQ